MRTTINDYEFINNKQLTKYVIPDGVKKIGNWAFWGCTSLQSVTIPDSVTEICKAAFMGCTNIQSVTIPRGCQYDDAFSDTTKVIIR